MEATTSYHKTLRVSMLIVTGLLIFDSGLILPITKQISQDTMRYVASSAVGVFASVPPNEFNQITAQLTKKERLLNEREAALAEREIKTRNFESDTVSNYSTYVLSIILFILTVLIVMNYVLDWMRIKGTQYEEQVT